MLYVLLVAIIAAVILLFLLILQRREIKSISCQLGKIKRKDTNEIVHTIGGDGACRELINEINSLLRETRSSRIDYQRKNHELEQMMTNISHDLRTPLTSAMGYIGMIRSSDLPQEEKDREIEIIEQRLIRLDELLNSFFEFSRVISSGRQPDTEELNLVAVIEEAVVHYYDDFCSQDREIEFHNDTPKRIIRSNRNMLMRIFDNLIGNALKHGTGNLSITLDAADTDRIRFENMPNDSNIDIDRIFDEFYTTDISRTKGNTGLGLAIAKQFTQMLGGEISAAYDGKLFSVTMEWMKKGEGADGDE